VHYQPIVSLHDGKTAGFEALARWRHPKVGLVAPDQFIKAAEEAGLISEIGAVVLLEASRQLGVWQRTIARGQKIFVTVNASPTQLLEKEFLITTQRIMEREQLERGSLKVEVTEAVVMRYSDRIVTLFGALRQLGIGLACDDFGTGFSSLSTLRNLPFDTLKLDKSFLSSGNEDDRAAHVIRTVLDLAHGLGMNVVCEGVETEDQAARLREMGCDFGQGFHFGVPSLARSVEHMIATAPLRPVDPIAPAVAVTDDALVAARTSQEVLAPPADQPKPVALPSIFKVANPPSVPPPLPISVPMPLHLPSAKRKKAVKKTKRKKKKSKT
jgi:EAL domain-containing protein (putative c-di-GMP-specific phosphodiesterase class I)